MFPFSSKKRYQNVKRYREILFILIKYGFEDIVDKLPVSLVIKKFSGRRLQVIMALSPAQRLRLAIEELGPTFIKFGQVLSVRSDILPEDYLNELEKLQDELPPFKSEDAKLIVERELRHTIKSLFRIFDEQPIATGSIAQVHKALLKTGEYVAVKIQRPYIKEIIETDIGILFDLANLLNQYIPSSRIYRPVEIVHQFAQSIRRELDFILEAQSVERFRRNFEGDNRIFVPKVYINFCSPKVLTVEYVDGIKISDIRSLKQVHADIKMIAHRAIEIYFKEIFEFKFFHGDPHPGNIFIIKDNVVAVIDYGITGRLDDETALMLNNLLTAFVNKDAQGMVNIFSMMDLLPADIDMNNLKADMAEVIDRYYYLTLGQLKLQSAFADMMGIIRRYHILFPTNLLLMIKVLIVLESVARKLDPDVDIIGYMRPYVQTMMFRSFNVFEQLPRLVAYFRSFSLYLRLLPSDLRKIIARLKKGKAVVTLEHQGLDHMTHVVDSASNRIAFAVVVASLIIGSSLVMQIDKGPMLFGFPIISFVGYLMAVVFGIWLLIQMIYSGRF
ncbi:MAG: ubiquinone biosynthesis protein UbiB [Candidatus Margulisiibacteriota bacterium]|nr:MAG: hypothetical protein A2X43_12070 [Candidatus Margulisbacteria bacterium GWD2_39_127]OGI03192.1 MAG: hypothetical protein A2X42_11310 [Candidatus Margulisbacteria bacterium GWF2_38_17]OGI11216.1 MAG: hypothetical protein A2X41_03735 [Candidatus Margulisbacteria bacterium GWE2_39_32]PZM78569.1 MAG: ubiquinone biosynthesis protein UbiB [Candidatus Margulisiibacteriota bacterium]HAR63864.1 ubiquinone biosynthesis protein UbiB [Candidatus Margulisiibacteriota bacterium]